jgi:hypothetical protein
VPDTNPLVRSLGAAEAEELGPMPDADTVTPTTDRYSRSPSFSAEVHSSGVVERSGDVAEDDRVAPPRSLSEED